MALDTSKIADTNRGTAATPKKPNKAGAAAGWADDRLKLGTLTKVFARKVFPDHWSFMLGEIALWSFVVLLLTGTFLTFWFTPSMSESAYQGSYAQLRGVPMSDAYASTLHISFDVRGGLLDAADAPLVGDALHRGDVRAHDADVRHRRLPQAARAELDHRFPAAAARHPRGLRRLLPARRPAVRHGSADRRRVDQGDTRGRHLHVVLHLRRGVPRRRGDPSAVHPPRAPDPRPDPGLDRPAHGAAGVPQAHPVGRPGSHRAERRRLPDDARSTWPRPAASSSWSSASPP